MAKPRWEFEVIRADDSTVDTVNGHLHVKRPLHLYLAEKAAEGWEIAGMAGCGSGLLYFIVLKRSTEGHADSAPVGGKKSAQRSS
ncbi:MAG: hypothetical protein NZ578_09950 [Candidatus Binatia bacterium]|nr:hypothetical protein [Candidatus Binatia bacterium]